MSEDVIKMDKNFFNRIIQVEDLVSNVRDTCQPFLNACVNAEMYENDAIIIDNICHDRNMQNMISYIKQSGIKLFYVVANYGSFFCGYDYYDKKVVHGEFMKLKKAFRKNGFVVSRNKNIIKRKNDWFGSKEVLKITIK